MSAPVTFRPAAALRMGLSLSISLVAAAILGWVMTPQRVRDLFTPIQVATLVLFLAVMVLCALPFSFSSRAMRRALSTASMPSMTSGPM